MVADVLFTLGSIIMAFSPSIGCLMFGRLVLGFGIGTASQIVPLYLSEVDALRDRHRFNCPVHWHALYAGVSKMAGQGGPRG